MKDYFITQEASTIFHLPMEMCQGGDIHQILETMISRKKEGLCDNHGFILRDTVRLVSYSIGKIVTVDRKSVIEYNITYTFQSLFPAPKDRYQCVINSITKMGIVGYLQGYTPEDSPLILMVPPMFSNGDETLNKKDVIEVEVMNSRIKYRTKQIQVVVKMV